MISRLVLSASSCFLLILTGCETIPATTATSVALGDYGVCKYENRIDDGKKIAVHFRCFAEGRTDENGKKYNPKVRLSCTDRGNWSIVLEADYYKTSTSLVSVEYQFDDGLVVQDEWERFYGLWPYAWQRGKEANREFIHGMKTAQKLTYSFDERTVTIDLTGVGNGTALFEENCNGLTRSKT